MAHTVVDASLASIQSGRLVETANAYIKKVCDDVILRERIQQAREVTITIKVKPDIENDDGTNWPEIDWDVKYKMPGSTGSTTRGFIEEGKLKVNQMDFEFPQQTTLGQGVDAVLGGKPGPIAPIG